MNIALPYQDLTIVEACLKTKTNYMDTANYEPPETAHFEYSWQWAYKNDLRKQELRHFLVLDLTPELQVYFLLMPQNIILMKLNLLIY